MLFRSGLPGTWEFWAEQDRRQLELCDEVVVLMLPGWRESEGVRAEVALAEELGKSVRYADAE